MLIANRGHENAFLVELEFNLASHWQIDSIAKQTEFPLSCFDATRNLDLGQLTQLKYDPDRISFTVSLIVLQCYKRLLCCEEAPVFWSIPFEISHRHVAVLPCARGFYQDGLCNRRYTW